MGLKNSQYSCHISLSYSERHVTMSDIGNDKRVPICSSHKLENIQIVFLARAPCTVAIRLAIRTSDYF